MKLLKILQKYGKLRFEFCAVIETNLTAEQQMFA